MAYNHRRLVISAGIGGSNVLGTLHDAQMVSSKPILPAEILFSVLDCLGPEDLIACARVSKRMREMVYDDTRWVRRLQLMGCWNESMARKQAGENFLLHTLPGSRNSNSDNLPHSKTFSNEAPLITLNSPTMLTPTHTVEGIQNDSAPSLETNGRPTNPPVMTDFSAAQQTEVSDPALNVFDKIQSKRGFARQEYGKVHSALAPLYKDAVKSPTPSNARVFRAYRDPEQQARMVAQLIRFSHADISLGWAERSSQVDAVSEAFENAIFAEFQDGLQRGDVNGKMKRYAHVLYHLNGGAKAVEAFLQQNHTLASPYRLGDATDWISVDDNHKFLPDEYLSFLRRVADAVHEQCEIIDRVFPAEVDVTGPFIDKVGDVIFARCLRKLFEQFDNGKSEQLVKIIPSTFLQNTGFLETLKIASHPKLSWLLELKLQKIYEPVISNYLQEELLWFQKKSDTEVTGWERQLSQQDASLEAMYMANINRQADKRDFLSSFKKVVMAPVNILPTISFGGRNAANPSSSGGLDPSSRSAALARRSSSPKAWPIQRSDSTTSKRVSRSSSPSVEPPSTELEAKAAIMQSRLEGIKTLFSLEVALSLVHMAKASIERAAIFAKNSSAHKETARLQCEAVFVQLLRTLGDRHVRSGFSQAVEHLSNYNPRAVEQREETQMVAPLVMFLELVNVGDLIQQMIDVFYEQELVATGLTDKNDFLDTTAKEKKRFEQMLDESVAAGLNKGIEALIAEVEYMCATTQNAQDFNPVAAGRNVDQIIDIDTTNTARCIVELVNTHTKMLTGSSDKNMLDVFNQEVGLRLFGSLCKHLKRQRISVAGAPRLMSDMNHYFVFIQTLKNKDLLQYFKALRELSQIYLVDGSNAKELATVIADHDRYYGIFGAEEVLEFAQRRADWYHIKPKVEKAMYGIGCNMM